MSSPDREADPDRSARALAGRDLAWALGLALAWTLGLCCALHGFVARDYFPLADQWAIVANSHPAFAAPLQWFTRGFSDYFVYDPAVSHPYADFLRPGFNAVYWLLGLALSPESGGYLYFNYAAMGACSGLVFLAIRQHPAAALRPSLSLAALAPLMPSMAPEFGVLQSPYGAFDPLVAALSLLVLLAYNRGRWALAAAVLLWAVFTKETVLPILAAALAAYLLHWWTARPRPSPWPLLLLALPLLLWLALRVLAFGNPAGGVYVLPSGAGDTLKRALKLVLQWPLWVDTLPFHLHGAGSQALRAWLLFAANLGFLLAAAGLIVLRLLRDRQPPRLAELGLLFSYGFMTLVGLGARYGAVLDVWLLTCLGLWLAERRAPRLGLLALLALLVGLAATQWRARERWIELQPLLVEYSQISRQYLAELKRFAPGETVLVLNDPVSWHSQARWLRLAGGVDARIVKAADFACPASALRLRQPCSVALKATATAGQFEFDQSCGIDWCGAFVSHAQPARLKPAPDIDVELLPGAEDGQWDSLRLTLRGAPVQLLYFDPADRGFHRYDPGAGSGREP